MSKDKTSNILVSHSFLVSLSYEMRNLNLFKLCYQILTLLDLKCVYSRTIKVSCKLCLDNHFLVLLVRLVMTYYPGNILESSINGETMSSTMLTAAGKALFHFQQSTFNVPVSSYLFVCLAKLMDSKVEVVSIFDYDFIYHSGT